MKMKRAMIVFSKDWIEVKRNWQIVLSMLVLPVIFSVFLPGVIGSAVASSAGNETAFMEMMPEQVRQETTGLTPNQTSSYFMLLYLFAPFFLLIPLMTSSVIAADSFAGEKERKTTEALLATPISDSELFVGKMLSAFLPALIITALSFVLYSAVVNAQFLPLLHRLVMPTLSWVLLVFALAPAIALGGIGVTVMISARVKGFREAQQISGILVLPVMLLLFAQFSGVIFLEPLTIAVITLVVLVLDAVIFRVGVGLFRREELLAKFG